LRDYYRHIHPNTGEHLGDEPCDDAFHDTPASDPPGAFLHDEPTPSETVVARIIELRQKRGEAVDSMRKVLATADDEGRELSAEENAQYEAWDSEQEALKVSIDREIAESVEALKVSIDREIAESVAASEPSRCPNCDSWKREEQRFNPFNGRQCTHRWHSEPCKHEWEERPPMTRRFRCRLCEHVTWAANEAREWVNPPHTRGYIPASERQESAIPDSERRSKIDAQPIDRTPDVEMVTASTWAGIEQARRGEGQEIDPASEPTPSEENDPVAICAELANIATKLECGTQLPSDTPGLLLRAASRIAEAEKMVREEREANCKAVCWMCEAGDVPFNDRQAGWVHCERRDYGQDSVYRPCIAAAIRARGNDD
jgi:predicted Zn-ribbon and HTH transcriptional regulator